MMLRVAMLAGVLGIVGGSLVPLSAAKKAPQRSDARRERVQWHGSSNLRVSAYPEDGSTAGPWGIEVSMESSFGVATTVLAVSELVDQTGAAFMIPVDSGLLEVSPGTSLTQSVALPVLPDGKYLFRATVAAITNSGEQEEIQNGLFYFQVANGQWFAVEDLNDWY